MAGREGGRQTERQGGRQVGRQGLVAAVGIIWSGKQRYNIGQCLRVSLAVIDE